MRRRAGRFLTGLAALTLAATVWPISAVAAPPAPGPVDRNPVPLNLTPPPWEFTMMDGRGDIVGGVREADQSLRLGEWPRYGPFVAFGAVGNTYVHGMNDRGDVIGDDERQPGAGFLWRDGRMTYLSMADAEVWPAAVNNRDQVVGQLSPADGPGLRAFSWRGGAFTSLRAPGNLLSYAVDVNDRGQVLVMLVSPDWSSMHGAVWEQDELTVIGRLDGPDTTVRAINNRGQVIGMTDGRPFLWDDGRLRDLLAGTGATTGFARTLNDRGMVIGEADSRSVVWTGGSMRYVIPRGYTGEIGWLNRRGDVAGGMMPATSSDPHQRLLFRWRDGRMTYYGAPAGSIAGLQNLDDRGRLVGYVDAGAGRQWVRWSAGGAG